MTSEFDHLAEDVGMSSAEFAEATGLEADRDSEREHVEQDLALSDEEYDADIRDNDDLSGPSAASVD